RGDTDPEPAPEPGEQRLRDLVAPVHGLEDRVPGDLAVLGADPGDHALRVVGGGVAAHPRERRAGGVGLEAAVVATAAAWAVRVEDDVAELGTHAGGPAVDAAVHDEAAADAGADGHQHHVRVRLPEAGLGERGDVRVVVDGDGEVGDLLQLLAHRPVAV